jgi:dihydroorotate dehydrogenase electron transfer subunit
MDEMAPKPEDRISMEVPATPPTLRHHVTPILEISQETPRTKAFLLSAPEIARTAKPGQFMMVWIPGVDEIPMSIAAVEPDEGHVEFAAAKVGAATRKLHKAKLGDLLGLRGPLGNGFELPRSKGAPPTQPLLVVAGGCGAPPILFATDSAVHGEWEVDVVLGATTEDELLYRRHFNCLTHTLILTTDDGSTGKEGTAVDGAKELLEERAKAGAQGYAACLACGPEPMLTSLVKLTEKYNLPLQVSLERYMKCGVGICGHCIIDMKGSRVCVEGPVFQASQLYNTDFGKSILDAAGRRLGQLK